jgi:phosphinothricin acetyltransferase
MSLEIRSLVPGDWKAVAAIYLDGIASGHATFETEVPSWEAWNRNHLSFARLVAVSAPGGAVEGWAALSPVSARKVYAGLAEVSVYVASAYRGSGVGTKLLKALIEESEKNGIWTLQAIVFPSNLASISVHRKCGFRIVGVRQRIGKMGGTWRDTILMERRSKKVEIN